MPALGPNPSEPEEGTEEPVPFGPSDPYHKQPQQPAPNDATGPVFAPPANQRAAWTNGNAGHVPPRDFDSPTPSAPRARAEIRRVSRQEVEGEESGVRIQE
jgi:hypothetical protein